MSPYARSSRTPGGSLESFYLAFGDFDVVAIVELPDDATAAAVLDRDVRGRRHTRHQDHTTDLHRRCRPPRLTKAKTIAYQPPISDLGLQTPMHAG